MAAAADALAGSLTAAAYPRFPPHRELFGLRRDEWIDPLQGLLELRPRAVRPAEQCVEHIRMRNPDLPQALRTELWHQYDSIRLSVLKWLHGLAGNPSADIRLRAAQTVGELGMHDFEFVYQQVITKWATSRGSWQREAAAFALEAAATLDPALTPHIHQLLKDWCGGSSRHRQLTAVTAFGTDLGAKDPCRALRSLRDLTKSGDAEMLGIASRSVVDLFETNSGVVVQELEEWTRSKDEDSRQLSLTSLVQLAFRHDEDGQPALLSWYRSQTGALPLVDLWRMTLMEREVSADAWDALRQWCRHSDADPRLVPPLMDLLKAVASTDPAIRKRIMWYLKFWADHHPLGPCATADKVLASIKEV